ncbi:MAG: rhodanese-related sulfurtransferase, partial [Patescibacteria group bacterium]
TGRVIIAEEGINATLEGLHENTEEFVREFLKDPRFANIDIKRSLGDGNSFPKLNVRVREEIVGTRFSQAEADPRIKTAPHLSVEELRSWYETNKDFVVVDMRNSYEYVSGHFKGSIDPGLDNSRDLPQAIEKLEPLKDKTVLTVCTGGVRCEKMSAFLLNKGFENVYQLDGGIHTYMEKYPGKDFLGTLYTFDQRVVMDFGGDREIVGTCLLCSSKTERYINCAYPRCNDHFLACESCVSVDQKGYCAQQCRTTHQGGE